MFNAVQTNTIATNNTKMTAITCDVQKIVTFNLIFIVWETSRCSSLNVE